MGVKTRKAKFVGQEGRFWRLIDESGEHHFLTPYQIHSITPKPGLEVCLEYRVTRSSGMWHAYRGPFMEQMG